ncbi:ankyrin repeat domain-containing protein [Wolbachia endosymbiont of Mansonella perstans]|uniref:ankyrin repeat domain-containing protein n=1 Tax=Wolbachia endosymbiont of Mansonella perstans TaxID=229526 RepID=UPI001CE07EAE|nr:ankyrin repeat domain-containing protein [Wolbachia endosymbiont of Mansonella perstans]MCA4773954.1 ankyrin repeat domain-containing protein [Wolbachia endosymbiont of Mansonella perstans]
MLRSIKANHKGETASHLPVLAGNLNIVECFVEKGANIDIPNNDGYTASHLPVFKGNLEMVKCLVGKKNVDINKANHEDNTALYLAVLKFLD